MSSHAFEWEDDLASVLAISVSQFRFLLAIFLGIPVAVGLRFVPTVTGRHIYSLVLGVLLLYYPFGEGCKHAIAPSLATYAALRFIPKFSGTFAWLVPFPYLILLHVSNASGQSWRQGQMDFTGAAMVLILKLISISYNRQDAQRTQNLNEYQKSKAIEACPSLLEFFSYLFAVGSLLVGPHFEFKDYKDYIERKGLWKESIPFSLYAVLRAFAIGVIAMGGYSLMFAWYPEHILLEDSFFNAAFLTKVWVVYLVGITTRLKYYGVWGIAETGLNLAGFGFGGYTGGDNGNRKAKWDRCKNASVVNVEMQESLAVMMHHWNSCTGNFLRRYVYDRLTPGNGKPTFVTLLGTQVVSGIWHGLYPGYILTFATSAICVNAARIIYKYGEAMGPKVAQSWIWKGVKFILTINTLSYTVIPFQLLEFRESLQVWGSLFYYIHVLNVGICILGMVFPPPKRKSQKAQ